LIPHPQKKAKKGTRKDWGSTIVLTSISVEKKGGGAKHAISSDVPNLPAKKKKSKKKEKKTGTITPPQRPVNASREKERKNRGGWPSSSITTIGLRGKESNAKGCTKPIIRASRRKVKKRVSLPTKRA